jgi:hypothetical protein
MRAALASVPTSSGPGIALDRTPDQWLRVSLIKDIFERHGNFSSIVCDSGGCVAHLQNQSIGFDAGVNGIVLTRLSAVWVF